MTIVNPYYARVFINSLANEKNIMWKGWNIRGSFVENKFLILSKGIRSFIELKRIDRCIRM
jgi:hypothetical protein